MPSRISQHSGSHHRRTSSQPATASVLPSSHATVCSLRENEVIDQRQTRFSSFDDLDNIHLPPPPSATFTFPATSTEYDPQAASPLEDYPNVEAGQQRSLTNTFFDNCRPLVRRATSTLQQQSSRAALHSPTKSLASFISLRGSAIPEHEELSQNACLERTGKRSNKLLGNFFNGASAPVNLGFLPSQKSREAHDQESDSEEEDEMFTSAPPALHRKHTSQSTASKFSWLVNSVTGKAATESAAPVDYEQSTDELLKLDITNALFPHGPADPLAASSFHDLQTNAEVLLRRFQTAYRDQAETIEDLKAEQLVQDEEMDECETRARHLKVQLDDMAAKATEQDRQMQVLRQQLDNERAHRIAAEEARLRNISIIRHVDNDNHDDIPRSIDRRNDQQRKRTSTSTSSTADSGFESDIETASSATSVFSHPRDHNDLHALAPPSSATLASLQDAVPQEATLMHMKRPRAANDLVLQEVRPAMVKPTLKGERTEETGAWAVVRTVREQNAVLSRRVQELEGVVEECTGLIASFGL